MNIWRRSPNSPSKGSGGLMPVVCGLIPTSSCVPGTHGKHRPYFRIQILDIDHLISFRIFTTQNTFVKSLLCADNTALNTTNVVYHWTPQKPWGRGIRNPISKIRILRLTKNCYLKKITELLSIQAEFEPKCVWFSAIMTLSGSDFCPVIWRVKSQPRNRWLRIVYIPWEIIRL